MRFDDPEVVAAEYARPERLAARAAVYAGGEGADPRDIVVAAVGEVSPHLVLEVGCGSGGLAERMARELAVEVVAVDLSPQMIELARERGVNAHVADVQELPFIDGSFDCAVAAWMLYHVPSLDRALAELERVLRAGGRLVAVTNGRDHLRELWELVDGLSGHELPFAKENGDDRLRQHFRAVERFDVTSTVVFPDARAAADYIGSSVTRSHLADRFPKLDGPLGATRDVVVFVADK